MPRNKLMNPDKPDPLRCTGRTTGLIMAALSTAILNPGAAVCVVDHHGGMTGKYLASAVEHLVKKYGLKHISVYQNPRTPVLVKFELWEVD